MNAQRDWGHAKDYVEGMYLMLQQSEPEDFVLATGITTTVRNFVKLSFLELGIELKFEGEDENEVGKVYKCNGEYILPIDKTVVMVDKSYFRPTEVDLLIGDASKAKEKLGWTPKYTLETLVKEMILSDIENEKNIYD